MKCVDKTVLIGQFLILFSSCGIETYRTFESVSPDDKIIQDENFDCSIGQVIYDFGNSYFSLRFTPKSDTEIVILNCTGTVSWRQKKTISPSSLKLSSTEVLTFHENEIGKTVFKSVLDTTFELGLIVPDTFRKISGATNSIQYNLEFEDTLVRTIPKKVDKIYFDLTIETSVNGKTKVHKRTVEVDSKKHRYVWFIRDC